MQLAPRPAQLRLLAAVQKSVVDVLKAKQATSIDAVASGLSLLVSVTFVIQSVHNCLLLWCTLEPMVVVAVAGLAVVMNDVGGDGDACSSFDQGSQPCESCLPHTGACTVYLLHGCTSAAAQFV
jgi:hypothetical protein